MLAASPLKVQYNGRTEHMSTTDNRKKVFEIISDNPVCMFTVSGAEDALHSRPMTVIKTEDNGELWFFTSSDGATVAEIGTESEVNLSFSGKGEWLSLRGSAVTITSEPKARELWNEAAAAFFPEGPGSPELALIRVRPEGAQFWNSPGGAITMAFHWAKARLTDTQIDAGESETVDL